MNFWKEYVVAAFVYNLQILPETVMCGVIIFGILLASQPLVALAIALGITQILIQTMGSLIMKMAPAGGTLTTSLDSCSTGFIGKSWARVLGRDPGLLWHPYAPSNYLATIGFFAGWGYGLQLLYSEEIDKGVFPRPWMTSLSILGGVVLLLAFLFRLFSGCETFIGALAGTTVGLLFGFCGCVALGYSTERRATNIWGIPLLRKKRR
jgi:hypothetical protein